MTENPASTSETANYVMSINTPADIYDDVAGTEKYAAQFIINAPLDNSKSNGFSVDGWGNSFNVTGYILKNDNSKQTLQGGNEDFEVMDNGNNLSIRLTQSGMKLAAGSNKIIFNVPEKVNVSSASMVSLLNSYTVSYAGYADKSAKTYSVVKDQEPTLYFGNIDVSKENESGEKLQGATFRVATSEENARSHTWVGPAITTDANGKGEFVGLAVDPESKTKNYYLVETAAPTGYERDHQIHEVTAKQDTDLDVTITDSKSLLPDFPFTGSRFNLYLMVIIALLVIGAGISLYVYQNKHRA